MRSGLIKGIILLLLFALPLYSQNVGSDEKTLKAVVNPVKGTVGQAFDYTLSIAGKDLDMVKVELPPNGEVYPVEEKHDDKVPAKQKAKDDDNEKVVPLYIISSSLKDVSESQGLKQINVRVQITYYRPGIYTLPEISVTDADGVKIGYNIPSVTIEELNKEGKPEDIEPPLHLSGNYTRLIIVIIALITVIVAGVLIYRYWKKRKKTRAGLVPVQTPIEFFMSEIERLRLRECIENGDVHEYVFGISITFRRFLSMSLGFDAAEMTTGEIASVIKRYMVKPEERYLSDEIVKIMDIWDLSKFAEFTLSKELLSVNLKSVIDVAGKIQNTGKVNSGAL